MLRRRIHCDPPDENNDSTPWCRKSTYFHCFSEPPSPPYTFCTHRLSRNYAFEKSERRRYVLAVHLGLSLPLRYMQIPLPDYRHFASISAVFGLWIQAEPLPRLTGS